ncbi:hypothetical protein [Caloramator sp. Dgby_cultured_2]|uniref:hypothetical protein n=1 Tax=Caloramator sp. Dgby_cultured_2 TaxID=3029174 RepID=UPI003158D9CB
MGKIYKLLFKVCNLSFLVTVIINVITALIVYSLRYQKYLNYIAPAVQSVLIGFIASCVPRRGVEEKSLKPINP